MSRAAHGDPFFEKGLPSNPEAERSILGAILLDNSVCYQAIELLRRDDFFLDSHRRIYDRMIALTERGSPIDIITLSNDLRAAGEFEQIGGATYLASLVDGVPRTDTIEPYAQILKESHAAPLDYGFEWIIARAFDEEEDPSIIVDEAEQMIFQIAEDRVRQGFQYIGDVAQRQLEEIEQMAGRPEMITGVPTGFTDFDQMTSGLQRQDLVIIAARPSMGKCLASTEEILLSDGSISTIEEVYHRRDAQILTLNQNWTFGFTKPSDFIDDGVKPVYRVETRLGRAVETTILHPFLTLSGWQKLNELKAGDKIAVPRRLNVFGSETRRECEVKLLAYFIGDGCLTKSTPEFTNNNRDLQKDFIEAIADFGGVTTRTDNSHGTRATTLTVRKDHRFVAAGRQDFARRLQSIIRVSAFSARKIAQAIGVTPSLLCLWMQGKCMPNPKSFARLCERLHCKPEELVPHGLAAISKNQKSAVASWLDELGLLGKNAHTKQIPASMFKLTRAQVALFLNRLFATDGWATVLVSKQAQIGYSTVSERLARQVQHLLLRFGIIATLKKRSVKYRESRRIAWQLDITDAKSLKIFTTEIGIFGKENAVAAVLQTLVNRRYQTNTDLIPLAIWPELAQAKGNESWSSLARRAGIKGHTNIHVGKRALSRERLMRLAVALQSAQLHSLASSDVYWDEIVSITPLGNKQVYDLTIPDTHNFVANDICVHNTAMALNMAQYAAKNGNTVGIFSLEMSAEQLVSRLLCSEARVDAHRFRTGYLNREEWARLADALRKLTETQIYIDDTAGMGVLEMRAKSRRLKAEHGLDLLIIDYMQLMSGRGRIESRQQEVSQISRELKGLAKEIDIPVLALSQLSRAPETRSDHRPQLSDLRESGCLAGDSLVVMADTSAQVAIRDLAGKSGFAVWALNESTMKLERAKVSRAFSTGVKPVYKMTTRLGREIRATANHKFRTFAGWKRLDELTVGDRLAVPRIIPNPSAQSMTDAELALLGHLIGDEGSLSEIRQYFLLHSSNTNRDVLPQSIWKEYVIPAMKEHGITSRQMMAKINTAHCGTRIYQQNVSRERAARIAVAVDSEPLSKLASSDVYWDEIKSIEFAGETDVYDLTVPILHNFVSADMITHNSIEQDADVVCFIYRDEVYNQTDENRGTAELLISKQRNGPTGTVNLAFLREFTRFENMWRE